MLRRILSLVIRVRVWYTGFCVQAVVPASSAKPPRIFPCAYVSIVLVIWPRIFFNICKILSIAPLYALIDHAYTFFVIYFTLSCFLLLLQLISILVHTIYSTLYFVILTEDDRSFFRNMFLKSVVFLLKDVRVHCYCASLVRRLFVRHARATSFSSVRTESKSQQNIELMTFALTWCANIFVGCSVTPTFFFGRSLPFLILSIILKNEKNLYVGRFNFFLIYYSNRVELVHGYRCAWLRSCIF